MNIYEQINELLSDKENYKVEKGKFFLKDMFDEWSEKKPNSLGVIDVRGLKFTSDDLGAAISGKEIQNDLPVKTDFFNNSPKGNILVDERTGKVEMVKSALPPDYLTSKEIAQGALNDAYKKSLKKERHNAAPKKRNEIRSAEIKIIRKMLSEKKSVNAIAKALNLPRFPVMYIVKQIKAGKKLKHETP